MSALGDFGSFRRTPDSNEGDHFEKAGAMATYSPEGLLIMLELVDPARVRLEGVQLLGEPIESVAHDREARGLAVAPDDMEATF